MYLMVKAIAHVCSVVIVVLFILICGHFHILWLFQFTYVLDTLTSLEELTVKSVNSPLIFGG